MIPLLLLTLFLFRNLFTPATAQTTTSPYTAWTITNLSIAGLPYHSEEAAHDPTLNTVSLDISDPNDYATNSTAPTPFTAHCTVRFAYRNPPYGTYVNCTPTSSSPGSKGDFLFAIYPTRVDPGAGDPSLDKVWTPGQDFTVILRLVLRERGVWFEGLVDFSSGTNMWGLCSAGGVCSFGNEKGGVAVTVTGPWM